MSITFRLIGNQTGQNGKYIDASSCIYFEHTHSHKISIDKHRSLEIVWLRLRNLDAQTFWWSINAHFGNTRCTRISTELTTVELCHNFCYIIGRLYIILFLWWSNASAVMLQLGSMWMKWVFSWVARVFKFSESNYILSSKSVMCVQRD